MNGTGTYTPARLAKMIDQTLLKAYATREDFEAFCRESDRYGFKMVAINSAPVKLCKTLLKDSDVLVGAAIGFPLGQTTLECKVKETELAIADGADEIDYVINIGRLKMGDTDYVRDEIRALKQAVGNKVLKVIIETCLLTDAEKETMCGVVCEAGADFIKTSTGFSTGGATFDDIALFARCVKGRCRIKAAGGIRSVADMERFIALGADRLGTSSAIKIFNNEASGTEY